VLSPIQDFLGTVLAYAYQILPNVGLAIILLTIVVNLALFPLTLKQTRSMKAMQEIQPQIKELQKKHKGDRQALNEEMVALYRERNVNPASGCLPMLVQLPIWFSLFSLLRSFRVSETEDPTRHLPDNSDLGNAILDGDTSFLGMDMVISPSEALQDGIGEAFPYLLLVVFIVVTGYYQQAQLTKRRADDTSEQTAQQKQMQTFTKVLPVVFGFISFGLLAGVDFYIAAGQVVRISSQGFIHWLDGREPPDSGETAITSPDPEEDPDNGEKPSFQGSKKKQQQRRRRRN
jgi:YidC/Oxa1 family membrane protein insertase